MSTPIDMLVMAYTTSFSIVKMQVEGLTHQDSLIQLPFRGNCLNWVMGHMVVSRGRALQLLDETPIWTDEAITARYNFNSEPITSDDDPLVQPFDKIMADYAVSQERLMAAFDKLPPDRLDEEIMEGRSTLGKYLAFLGWHDGYHAGQTEYLRQLAGKDDKVV